MKEKFEEAGYTDPIMVLEAIGEDPSDPPPVIARAVHVLWHGGCVTPAVRRAAEKILEELDIDNKGETK